MTTCRGHVGVLSENVWRGVCAERAADVGSAPARLVHHLRRSTDVRANLHCHRYDESLRGCMNLCNVLLCNTVRMYSRARRTLHRCLQTSREGIARNTRGIRKYPRVSASKHGREYA